MDDTLTNALAEIKRLAFSGFGLLEGTADEVFWWAASFAVFFGIIAWMLRPNSDPVSVAAPWMSLLIVMYVVAVILRDFIDMTGAYMGFMSDAGIFAGGGGLHHGLEDISAVVENGWNASAALWKALNGFWIYFDPGSFFVLIICVILVVGTHCFLAYRLIKLFGEFYILSVITFFCIPFAVWHKTMFMAEGPAKYIIATGLSTMAIGFGYALVHAMVGAIVFDPTFKAGYFFGKAFSMFLLLLIVSGLPIGIRSMISGTANTNFGGEGRSMMLAASTAAGGARLAMLMGGAGGAAQQIAGGASGSQSPSGISINTGWQPSSSTGSGGGATAALTDSSNVRRI